MTDPGLRTDLWPHQRAAVEFAAGRRGTLIAHEMGCGKTATAIALLRRWGSRRVLVACPLSVAGVWPSQLARHDAEPWVVARLDSGPVARRAAAARAALEAPGRACLVVNHEAAWREPLRSLLLGARLDAMVVDEAHRAKAPGGRLSMFLHLLSRRVGRRLALTGTPLPHSPLDAYGVARFVDATALGTSFARFRARYAVTASDRGADPGAPAWLRHKVVGWQHMDEFEGRLATFCHRARKADVLDLPPEVDAERTFALEPAARRVYDQLEESLVAEVAGGTVTAANALVRLLRLQQVVGGALPLDDGSIEVVSTAKRDALADLLADLDPTEPVVVFCKFRHDLDAVRAAGEAAGRRCGELSGRRRDVTERGTMPEDVDLLAVQIQAGGLGVDLTRAALAVYYSVGWSLGDLLQARGRLHRPGQARSVTHLMLTGEGTVDAAIARALARRQDLVEGVLERMLARQGEGS